MRQGRNKFKGKDLSFDCTAETDRIEDQVRKLTEFLANHSITGGNHLGYRRIFHEGDTTPYRWNKGGRLYSIGDGSYQTLKKEQRLAMTIDGEPVVEIDIRASYLTLLHGLRGLGAAGGAFDPKLRDSYHVGDLPRAIVKAWVTMTIGHEGFHR